MSTATETGNVRTSSPPLTKPAKVTYRIPAPSRSIEAANRRLTAGYETIIRRAEANCVKRTGSKRF